MWYRLIHQHYTRDVPDDDILAAYDDALNRIPS
jgi:hypothetical protein